MTLSRLLTLPYFILLAIGLMVPSDAQHGILSIKSLAFLSAMGAIGSYALLRQKVSTSQLKLLSFACASVAVLLLWLLISLAREQTTSTSQFDQFKLFLITLAVPLTTLYLVKEGIATPQQIFKTAIYASFAYALLKVLLVAFHLLHIINAWSLIDKLGIRYMRMGIYGGLDRFQTSVDIATPFLLFFLLNAPRLSLSFSNTFRYAYIAISLLSTFLSFSRYLIFIYMASCFLYILTLNPRQLIKVAILLFLASLAAFFAIGPEKVSKVIHRRVFSVNSFRSDETRVRQGSALLEAYNEVPFIGKGIGGYVPDHIRDSILLHSYEVQWMAFLMQFGLLGLLFLLTPLLLISWRLIEAPFSRVRYAFLGTFLLWLLSGFTNPFLISLTSGIIYALFCLAPEALHHLPQFTGNRALQYDKEEQRLKIHA